MEYVVKIKGNKWETFREYDAQAFIELINYYETLGYTVYFSCVDYYKNITVAYLERT